MHELALAQTILDTVGQAARANGIARVTSLRLVVGAFSGVMAEALEFGLEVLARGGPADGARIEIERPPLVIRCRACGIEQVVEDFEPTCPNCGHPGVEVAGGDELRIESFEGE